MLHLFHIVPCFTVVSLLYQCTTCFSLYYCSLIGLSCSSPLPSLSQIATFPLLSPHLYSWGLFKAAEPLKCWWMRGGEGDLKGRGVRWTGWQRGRRGVGGVARMVAHLPAPHPPELGMTHFLRHPRLSAPPNQLLDTYKKRSPHLNLINTSLSAPHKIPRWLASDVLTLNIKVSFESHHCLFCQRRRLPKKERVLFCRHTSLRFLVGHGTWLGQRPAILKVSEWVIKHQMSCFSIKNKPLLMSFKSLLCFYW